jgi:hypothetical protein
LPRDPQAQQKDEEKVSTTHDPKLYREMSAPFDNGDDANAALQAFYEDVGAARKKHRISDVVVLCEIAHMLDGSEVRGSSSTMIGHSFNHLPMLAREYGAARQRHEDMLKHLISESRKTR